GIRCPAPRLLATQDKKNQLLEIRELMEPSCQSGCRYALLLLLVLQTLLLVATPAAVRAAPVLTEDELEEPDGLNEMLLESERLNEEKRSLEAIRQFGGQLSENAIPFRRPPQLPPPGPSARLIGRR
ncbi:hypothetical protein BOX15_Mlig016995g1, partial [Macrostomum lignano]